MTQHINLYTAEFRARRQYLGLPWVAAGCGALLLLGALATVVQWRYGAGVRADIVAAQAEVDALNRTLATERARLAQHVALPELTRQLQKLQEELAAKAQLVAALQNTPLAVRNGYAPVFEALARHPLDGLWLTRIDVIGDAVNLAGEARRPELVPEYIATLTGDAQFSAQSYEVLAIQRNDRGLMRFEIRRRAGDARP